MMEKDFSTLTKTSSICEVSVQINHEEGKKLKLNKEYTIDVELQIIDELNRRFITNEVMLCINTEKSTLKSSPNIRLQFNENKKSISRYYFTPSELGEEIIELDFLQNFEPIASLPCKLHIV